VTDQERMQLLRAHGRIEPRTRFKGGPVVRVRDPERHYLFIDESGKSLPGGSPFFALGAVAMTGAEVMRYRRRADGIKKRYFGRRSLTFHEPAMRHREGDFSFGDNPARQLAFDRALRRLVSGTEFVAFGVGIRKAPFAAFNELGGDAYLPADMYAVAIQLLLERYVDFRAMSGGVRSRSRVIFEGQGPKEDAVHQRDFADALLDGTQWLPGGVFQQWLETGVEFRPKQGSDPIELADMLSRDLYEWLQADCSGSPGRWDIFTRKTYCRGDGNRGKFGIKIFPADDVEEAVMAHRRAAGAKQ
jgi:hypothetical protein